MNKPVGNLSAGFFVLYKWLIFDALNFMQSK